MFKGCLGFVVAVLAIIGVFALLNADPALPDQAASAWTWATSEAAHVLPKAAAPTAVPVMVVPTGEAMPPTPPPPPVTTVSASAPWTIFDCAYAVDTLTEDAQLDGRAFADGLGPEGPPYYYATIAAQWKLDAGYARAQCGHPRGTLSGAELTAPPQQFVAASLTHQGDMANNPANAAWDEQWIAAYAHLEVLWASLS